MFMENLLSSIKINMNKYTLSFYGFIVVAFISALFWYTSDTQVTERKMADYQEKIESLNSKNDSLSGSISDKEKQIETLKASIESDRSTISENNSRIEKYNLCIKSKSMDCDKADKTAMLSLIPQANATIADENSPDDVREGILSEIFTGTLVGTGKVRTYYTNNPVGDQCEGFHNEPTRIVLHYTATPSNIPVENIVASHHRKNGTKYYAGYHYIVQADGTIVNTRPENCNALAAPDANHDGIHISYVWDDKPTDAQTKAIVWLVKDVSKRLKIDRKNVTAHADIQAKNYKESMEYMFGGYEIFQQLLRAEDIITRDGKQLDALTYAWRTWWDMDFVLTLQKESQFNPDSKGDIDNPSKWHFSFGYCQYNTKWQSAWYDEYTKLKTYQEKLNHCHEKYTYASTLPGGVWSRFHGYNDRMKNKDRFVIQ